MEFSSFENAGRGTPASDHYHSVAEVDISNYVQRFAASSTRSQGYTLETADDYEVQVHNITKNLHQNAHFGHGLRDSKGFSSTEKILARSLLLSTKEENESMLSKNKIDSSPQKDYWSQKSLPVNTKTSWSEQNSLKSRLSPSEIDHSIEEQNIQFAQSLPRQPKVAYFDITKVQGTPSDSALREQLEKLQHDNIATKLQLEKVVRKYEDLSVKFKDCEELKNKNLNLAKRYEEQLKNLNKNYCTLQKENKELATAVKASEKQNKLPKKPEIAKSSPKASKEVDELREKLDFLKNELVASKEGEKTYKQMYQEQVQLVNYLNEKYEKDTREKDFLMSKNIELIERFGKLQQNIKENTAPDSQERIQYSQQNTQILELQKIISRLECQNFALRKRNDELSLQLEAQESLKTEEEAIKLIEKSSSLKELDISKRPESTKNSRNPTETFGDDDSGICTFITKDDKEYQSILSSYNPLDDEALNTIKIELEGKLATEDFQMIEMLIDKHIDTLQSSLQSTELVNRYNKLLINYFKALDKIRMSTKTKTIHLQKVEMQSDFSNTTPHSQNIQDFQSPKNFTASLPAQEDLDAFESATKQVPLLSIKKQIIQPKLLIDVKNDLIPEARLNKSHSLEGQKISSLLSTKEKPSRGDLESFASNPNLKKIIPRSVSASKKKDSYRDIYNQRKKEILENSVGDKKGIVDRERDLF